MSVFGIAAKTVKQNKVSVAGVTGLVRTSFMKVLPMDLVVARKSARYNRIGISLPDTDIKEGEFIKAGGDWYIVGNITKDLHKGRPIRSVSELVWCSHLDATVQRPDVVRDPFSGSIIGETTTQLFKDVKLLFSTAEVFSETDRDTEVGYWNAYVSKLYGLLRSETQLIVDGSLYEIKYHRDDIQGVYTYRVMKAAR